MCFCCCGTVFIPDNYCTMIHRFRLLTNQKILLKIIQNLFQQLIVFCSQYYWITGDNSYNSNDDYSVAKFALKITTTSTLLLKPTPSSSLFLSTACLTTQCGPGRSLKHKVELYISTSFIFFCRVMVNPPPPIVAAVPPPHQSSFSSKSVAAVLASYFLFNLILCLVVASIPSTCRSMHLARY